MFLLLIAYIKKYISICMNSDADKTYTAIVDFIENYNFVVHTFFHLKSF
jgi:flagellar capping protein FliD